jgi:hypothetical protein
VKVLEKDLHVPTLGTHGEPCSSCGAPLASDQRYCLNCGQRRAAPRVAFERLVEATGSLPATETRRETAVGRAAWPPGPGAVAAGLALLLLALGVGALMGRGKDQQIALPAAARPQVITVNGGAGATAAPAEKFVSDWPDGKVGYTVRLQALPKDGTAVAAVNAAKASAESKGATSVGALDSDDFQSLDSGEYVIYSGTFDKKADAQKALKKLKGDFPGARVIKVGSGGAASKPKTVDKSNLKELEKTSPGDYSKKSRKLPDKLKLPGKPPPKDNKKPGGGGKTEVIG